MTTIPNKNSYLPGKIDITTIGIKNFQSQFLPIDNTIVSFRIYEDIFSNTMNAEFVLLDAIGLIENLPLLGEEAFILEFKTPNFDETYQVIMDIYKISGKEKINERSDQYKVHCVSREFITSMNRTTDKAYTGPIDKMVSAIYNNILKHKQVDKPLFVESTNGLHSFIAPENAPLDFINFLASEARSKEDIHVSNYLFYEDHKQFNFRTISGLFKQEPVEDFYWAEFDIDENTNGMPEVSDEQKIVQLDYLNQFDVVKQTESGMFDNSSLIIDPLIKKVEERDFLYYRDFDRKLPKLGGFSVLAPSASANESYGASHTRYFPSRISEQPYHSLPYMNKKINESNDPFSFYPTKRQNDINATLASSASINNLAFNIKIKGNSDIKAGDIINVYIPSNEMNEEEKNTFNRFFGNKSTKNAAKFLVVRVCHYYNNQQANYETEMKVIKDSYASQFSSEVFEEGY